MLCRPLSISCRAWLLERIKNSAVGAGDGAGADDTVAVSAAGEAKLGMADAERASPAVEEDKAGLEAEAVGCELDRDEANVDEDDD